MAVGTVKHTKSMLQAAIKRESGKSTRGARTNRVRPPVVKGAAVEEEVGRNVTDHIKIVALVPQVHQRALRVNWLAALDKLRSTGLTLKQVQVLHNVAEPLRYDLHDLQIKNTRNTATK